MRALFIVGGKLLGIYLIIDGLNIALLLGTRSFPGNVGPGVAVQSCVFLVSGTVLLYFTDGVARLVRLGIADDLAVTLSHRVTLTIGLILVGINQSIDALARVGQAIYYYMHVPTPFAPGSLNIGVADVIKLLISLVLIFGANPLAKFFMRHHEQMIHVPEPSSGD